MKKVTIALVITISIVIYGKFSHTIPSANATSEPKRFDSRTVVSPSPRPTSTSTPIEKPQRFIPKTVYKGLASYYSRAGCLGCSKDFIMADGEPLDDSKLTIAFNHAPMDTMVKITNVQTGQSVFAKVTDTGGFEHVRIPKIADLSVATKEALGCAGTCEVQIEL